MSIYIKVNNTEYPAAVNGNLVDRNWNGRDTKTIYLTMSYDAVVALLPDNTPWSIVQRETQDVLDEQGNPTGETEEVVNESEYVGTMLNRHAARFLSQHGPVTETEYSREEAPRRIWDDFTPPDFDYRNRWVGKGGKKAGGYDLYELTSEGLAL